MLYIVITMKIVVVANVAVAVALGECIGPWAVVAIVAVVVAVAGNQMT